MTKQTEIPGCETPPDPAVTPELDAIVHGWLDAKDEQRRAAATSKLRHEVMLAQLKEAGIARYPYTDRTTGAKRYVVIAADPKARTIKPPRPARTKDEKAADKRREKKQRDAEESVEHRKVSRASVEAEVGPLDPFAATRAAMEAR